jgi:integrase
VESRWAELTTWPKLFTPLSASPPQSPHALRRTFCTAGLLSGVPLRDMQYAMRHGDARTTIRYHMARTNLDRHAAHNVAAYLFGMAVGLPTRRHPRLHSGGYDVVERSAK